MDFVELGKTLAKIRKEQKISQQTMAKDLQLSRATISSFENGRSVDIGFKKLLQMIDYLGFELELKERSPFPVLEELLNER